MSNNDDSDSKELKDELDKAEKKIETMEKKIQEQEKKDISIKHYKSEGTTLVLSIVAGLFGLMGIGHIYLGQVKRGVIILILGFSVWVVIIIPIVIFAALDESGEDSADPTLVLGMLGGLAIVGIGVLVLFIWQIINARKLWRQYNDYLEEHGKPPW